MLHFQRSFILFLTVLALCGFPAQAREGTEAASISATSLDALPSEVRTTLQRIRQGGPFPFRRDGAEFQNRESRLPHHSRNYYREYTVMTPGARDRGARRIISGSGEEFYYTPDHYRTFKRITP